MVLNLCYAHESNKIKKPEIAMAHNSNKILLNWLNIWSGDLLFGPN